MHISFKKNKGNQSLWERYVAGDKTAFGTLYAYYHPGLTAFCIGRLGSIEVAENVASETLIKLLQHAKPAEIENIESWIFTVAKNECVSYLGKSARREHLLRENYKIGNNQQPEVESKFSTDNIDQIIRDNLDERDYKIWQLHQQGYDNKEIADIISSNEKTVANRKSMVRTKLKSVFKNINNQ